MTTKAWLCPRGLIPTLALAWVSATTAVAQTTPDGRFPVTPQQRDLATQVAQAGVPLSELAPSAPDEYTVKRGDTLWGLSSLYLTSPWRWPELWGMNKEAIGNPHLIYPGQTLRLIKRDGRALLTVAPAATSGAAAGNGGVTKLSPRVREAAPDATAIASIPSHLIEPYLVRPLVVEADALESYPRIVATPETRLYVGGGDLAFARGIVDPAVRNYAIFRPAEPLFDPDDVARRRPIAFEASYVGTAEVIQPGPVTGLRITASRVEVGVGDRLVPVPWTPPVNFVPRAPTQPVEGRIVSVYGGLGNAAQGSVVALNRGKGDGLDVGSVLALWQTGGTVRDRTERGEPPVTLPDQRLGSLFVFRVFDHIAYALVVRSVQPVSVGDRFSNPEPELMQAAARRAAQLQAPPPRPAVEPPAPQGN